MPKIVNDQDIYQAVIQIVSELGYSRATTRQMAQAAGVSEMTLFRKFSSKANLVRQAIAHITDQTDFSNAAQYTGDLRADLLRVVKAYQDTAVQHSDFISTLFSEMSRHPELVESMDGPFSIFMGIGELFIRYQLEGQLRKEHPLHALAALLGPIMYIALLRKTMPDKDIPPLDPDVHVTRFLEGQRS